MGGSSATDKARNGARGHALRRHPWCGSRHVDALAIRANARRYADNGNLQAV